jgi:lipoate-protein ligase A
MVKTGKTARFISLGRFDAATNMAIDEAILEANLDKDAPPTLRLYEFTPPAVSIGYSQRLDSKTIKNIDASGFAIVRRPTGGRAVLHKNDLTYSFVGSSRQVGVDRDNILSTSVIGSYKQICQGLILAFKQLGLTLEFGRGKSLRSDKVDCFEAVTIADLHYQGRKLVGSAQVRRRHAVLQHGSIILDQAQGLMQELIGKNGFENSAPHSVHHANLYEIAGRVIPQKEIEAAIISGFEQAFSIEFVPSSLTANELAIHEQLRDKYVVNSWQQSVGYDGSEVGNIE